MDMHGQFYAPATLPKHPLEGSWVGPSANPDTEIKSKIPAAAAKDWTLVMQTEANAIITSFKFHSCQFKRNEHNFWHITE